MNIQFFPNYFKKIALVGFILLTILSGGDDFVNGFQSARNDFSINSKIENTYRFHSIFGDKMIYWFGISSLSFLLLYMLSKEKVDDDFIKLLRLESFQTAFLIIILFSLLFLIFGLNYRYGLKDTMTIFMLLYLVIFAIKKRNV